MVAFQFVLQIGILFNSEEFLDVRVVGDFVCFKRVEGKKAEKEMNVGDNTTLVRGSVVNVFEHKEYFT